MELDQYQIIMYRVVSMIVLQEQVLHGKAGIDGHDNEQ